MASNHFHLILCINRFNCYAVLTRNLSVVLVCDNQGFVPFLIKMEIYVFYLSMVMHCQRYFTNLYIVLA